MRPFQRCSIIAINLAYLSTASPASATPLEWTNSDGKSIRAEFVRIEGESVVVNKDGKSFTIPFAKLSRESVEQAKKLSGNNASHPAPGKVDISPENFFGKTFEDCEKILGKPSASLNQFEKEFRPDVQDLSRIKIKEMTLGRKSPDGKEEAALGMYISYYFKKDTINSLSGALEAVGIPADGWTQSTMGTALSDADKNSMEKLRNMPLGEYLKTEFRKMTEGMGDDLATKFAPGLYPSMNGADLGYSLYWESSDLESNLDPHPDEDVLRVRQTFEDAIRRRDNKGESATIPNNKTDDIGTLAHYRFDGDAKDATNKNGEFSLNNTEFRDNALYLNGIYEKSGASNGYLASCIIPGLNYEKFSVAMRFKADELIRRKNNLITCGRSYRWFGLEQSPNGKLQVTFNNGRFRKEIEGASLEAGKWTVVACSVDVGGRIVNVALDGKRVATLDLSEDFMLDVVKDSTEQNWKGTGDRDWLFTNYGNGNVFHGLVDELIIYGSALDADELEKIPLQP